VLNVDAARKIMVSYFLELTLAFLKLFTLYIHAHTVVNKQNSVFSLTE
jgi:hypothetical protein